MTINNFFTTVGDKFCIMLSDNTERCIDSKLL